MTMQLMLASDLTSAPRGGDAMISSRVSVAHLQLIINWSDLFQGSICE